jgi:hypothetical protein
MFNLLYYIYKLYINYKKILDKYNYIKKASRMCVHLSAGQLVDKEEEILPGETTASREANL